MVHYFRSIKVDNRRADLLYKRGEVWDKLGSQLLSEETKLGSAAKFHREVSHRISDCDDQLVERSTSCASWESRRVFVTSMMSFLRFKLSLKIIENPGWKGKLLYIDLDVRHGDVVESAFSFNDRVVTELDETRSLSLLSRFVFRDVVREQS